MMAAAALFGAAIPNAVFSSPSQASSPRPKRRRIVKSELISYRGANYRYSTNGDRERAWRAPGRPRAQGVAAMKALRILVGCETSGVVRRAFSARGW
jgi:hypothetical protein